MADISKYTIEIRVPWISRKRKKLHRSVRNSHGKVCRHQMKNHFIVSLQGNVITVTLSKGVPVGELGLRSVVTMWMSVEVNQGH